MIGHGLAEIDHDLDDPNDWTGYCLCGWGTPDNIHTMPGVVAALMNHAAELARSDALEPMQWVRCRVCKASYTQRHNYLTGQPTWVPGCGHPAQDAELVGVTDE